MITGEELEELLKSTENYRVEKTVSTTNMDKFCEAICAFANDMPGSGKKGYLLIGVNDDNTLSGLRVSDELQIKISNIRSDGNILPLPQMSVDVISFDQGDVLVVEVSPSVFPPVRYRGRTCVRIGPRKGFATMEEERILIERCAVQFPSFDTRPCLEATLEDIDTNLFLQQYLPLAINKDDIEDTRPVKEQMAALRLYNMKYDCPTYAAIILFGKNPKYFLMGDYIQFVRYNGEDNASDVINQYEFHGNLCAMLPKLDTFIETSLIQNRPSPTSVLKEKTIYNYPLWAIRELLMNAVMHREYQSNTPVKLYQYTNRIEVVNAGGLYGNATVENFPKVNDYRNPIVAEALKLFGYVNKFNRGVSRVQKELVENGNGEAVFSVDKVTVFEVLVNEEKLTQKLIQKLTQKLTQKTTQNPLNIQNLLDLLEREPFLTRKEISEILGMSENTIKWQLSKLKQQGLIERAGGRKNGYWQVVKR
jgi:ATP-dependent DNA helicase RecG